MELSLEVERELTAMDLAGRDTVGSVTPKIKSLKSSHHKLAEMLASGEYSQREISRITGVSESRISILKGDPAFKELIAHYGAHRARAVEDIVEQLRMLGLDALQALAERLQDEPETFGHRELLEVVKVTMDRIGHGPTSKIEQLSVSLTMEQLERLKSAAFSKTLVVEKEPPAAATMTVVDLDETNRTSDGSGMGGAGAASAVPAAETN